MGLGPERAQMLLLVAAIVAIIARRLRLPYTVGLVIAGIALAFLPISGSITFTRSLIYSTFLPPLVFEGALYITWPSFRRDLPVILVLATVGVLISALVTAAGMSYLAGWQWAPALVFGALIAATDPVSVIALFREMGVRGRLRLLMESESLLNDGTAAVAFGIAISLATGGWLDGWSITRSFLSTILGGIACGAAVAGGVLLLAGRTEDVLVEITFTTVAAYGSFALAERLGVSGVLAAMTAGVVVRNLGPLGLISERGRQGVRAFWEYFAFVVNSLVFLLIGIREAHTYFRGVLAPAGIAIVLILIGRALAVYGCCSIFARSNYAVPARTQHILVWGGLRGALALALALSLPPTLPQQKEVTTVAFAVVAFSVIVQGLTMGPFLRKMNVCGPEDETDE